MLYCRLSGFAALALLPGLALAQLPTAPKAAAPPSAETLVLQKATELIQSRQYETAFKLLNKFDPQHHRPAVVLRQTELALTYHLRSREYEGFGFIDLKPLDRLDSLRARYTRAAIRYPFAVEPILKNLLRRYPTNYKINRALADYYYQVEQCTCAEADKTPAALYALMARHYAVAHAHGLGDATSYYAFGYARLSQARFAESVPLLQRAIALRPTYAQAYFQLAYSYTELKKLPQALSAARAAARFAENPDLKYDAEFVASELERRLPANSTKNADAKKKP